MTQDTYQKCLEAAGRVAAATIRGRSITGGKAMDFAAQTFEKLLDIAMKKAP